MCLLNDSLFDVVKRGLVDPREAYAKSVDKASLLGLFTRGGVDVSWAPKDQAAGAAPPPQGRQA